MWRLFLLLVLAPALAALDLTGTWDAKVESTAGPGTPVFVLRQEGDRLSGDFSGKIGKAKLTGSVHGAEVAWSFVIRMRGQSGTVVYQGTMDGGVIRGSVDFGGRANGTFVATKR